MSTLCPPTQRRLEIINQNAKSSVTAVHSTTQNRVLQTFSVAAGSEGAVCVDKDAVVDVVALKEDGTVGSVQSTVYMSGDNVRQLVPINEETRQTVLSRQIQCRSNALTYVGAGLMAGASLGLMIRHLVVVRGGKDKARAACNQALGKGICDTMDEESIKSTYGETAGRKVPIVSSLMIFVAVAIVAGTFAGSALNLGLLPCHECRGRGGSWEAAEPSSMLGKILCRLYGTCECSNAVAQQSCKSAGGEWNMKLAAAGECACQLDGAIAACDAGACGGCEDIFNLKK